MISGAGFRHSNRPSVITFASKPLLTNSELLSLASDIKMGSVSNMYNRPPAGAWDSHVHVVDEDRFPLHPFHPYRPRTATVGDLETFHSRLGISHACIVTVSVYHTDPRSILDALSHLGGKARAVACIDPATISDDELRVLHQAGVRGIRLNLRTRGDALDKAALQAAANRVRPLGWALQLYVALDQVPDLAPLVPRLGVTVVLDHLASPHAARGPARLQKGYAEFMELLRSGLVWTKLSGTYRFADLPDLDDYVTDILIAAPDRVVWASDWPHTGGVGSNPGGDRTLVQDYRNVDDVAWVQKCWDWCVKAEDGDGANLARKIWVENPRKLWQYDQ